MVFLLTLLPEGKNMNDISRKETEVDETSALVGELPTWSIKKLFFQLGLIIALVVAILFLALKGDGEQTSTSVQREIVVSTDGPVIEHSGYRYQFGEPGDLVVVRECNGTKLPWLLRISTGELFRFDTWAKNKVAEASLIRRIDGSSGISVTKDPTCDQLVISKSNGDPLILAN
mgnify:CR=1 FL=1|tara:strand:- start:1530 stop:2051 length:522 start_codon:yes stop_codon:yes gene_type:complete